jgi:hypothetical protein
MSSPREPHASPCEPDPADDNADVVVRPAAISDAELEGAREPGGGPRHGMEAPDGEADIQREQGEADIQREQKARP